jgi:hypothetical protein
MPKKKFDLNSYVLVAERLALLKEKYPDSQIMTRVEFMDGPEVVMEARIFKTREDRLEDVFTNGFAREIEGSSYIMETSHLETAETSAIGRALANMGFKTTVDEPRPSREEMEKVERMQENHAADLEEIQQFVADGEDFDVEVNGKTVGIMSLIKKNATAIETQPSRAASIVRMLRAAAEETEENTSDEDDEDDDGLPTVSSR